MFQRDQKGFFRTLEEDGIREGEMPEMDKFVDFWGGIWERKERTPYMPWMEEIGRRLRQKINSVNDFTVTFQIMFIYHITCLQYEKKVKIIITYNTK